MSGLLVIERTFRFDYLRAKDQELALNYCGIEGVPWPNIVQANIKISCGLAMPEQMETIFDYYRTLSGRNRFDLLYLRERHTNNPHGVPLPGFEFCGIDYGSYVSENNLFSVVFNEVLFGRHNNLRKFSSRLNKRLLFEQDIDIDELISERSKLVRNHEDLETFEADEKPQSIDVFRLKG